MSGGRRAVLKIDEELHVAPRNDRSAEAALQSTAHDAGLAARVLYADKRCLLTEYIEGTVWSRSHLRSPSKLKKLGRALRSLHELPLCGRTFDAIGAARDYASRISEEPDKAENALSVIASIGAPTDVRLCHNDLVAGNIVEGTTLRFIDWEYACDNDPLFDLATLIAHHQFDEQQTHALMRAYSGADWRNVQDRLSEQIRLYDALLWLWQASRESSPGVA